MTMPGKPAFGGTILRIAAIASPNFVNGVSGWIIRQDGSAQFNSIVVPPGTSGNTIFVQSTTPTALAVGDMWISTINANMVSTWNGITWVPNLFGTNAIASGAITTGLLAANAVTAAKIAANTITASQIAANTITASQIAAGTITATQIASNTITATQLAAAAGILGTQLANGTLTTTQLAAAAGILGAQIATNTITGGASGNIAATTITAANIAANTITASQIAANTITASQIAANTITAGQIASATITATQLAAGIVYAGIVDATTITGAQLIATGTQGEVLAYSGTPATGNLIGSISGRGFTDSHSNAVILGVVAYNSGNTSYSALQSGQVLFFDSVNTTTWSIAPASVGVNTWLVITPSGTGALFIDSKGMLNASTSGGGATVETWHSPSLSNGWAASSTFKYKLNPDNTVAIQGNLDPAAKTSNLVFTLPAGYVPNSTLDYPIGEHAPAALGTAGAFVRVASNGQFSVVNSSTTMGVIVVSIRVPLDY